MTCTRRCGTYLSSLSMWVTGCIYTLSAAREILNVGAGLRIWAEVLLTCHTRRHVFMYIIFELYAMWKRLGFWKISISHWKSAKPSSILHEFISSMGNEFPVK